MSYEKKCNMLHIYKKIKLVVMKVKKNNPCNGYTKNTKKSTSNTMLAYV